MENEYINGEVMDEETTAVEPVESEMVETKKAKQISTGMAILIGGAAAVAGIAIGKRIKSAIAKHKAKKALKEETEAASNAETVVAEEDLSVDEDED